MSELLTVDGVDIKTLAYNVETLGATLVKPARRGANAVVAGRSGVIRTPDKLHEAPTYPWPMWVRGCDENGEIPVDSDARQMFFENLDKLTALFDKDGVLDVRHTQPGSIAADVRNLVTNPSGRKTSGTATVRENLALNPAQVPGGFVMTGTATASFVVETDPWPFPNALQVTTTGSYGYFNLSNIMPAITVDTPISVKIFASTGPSKCNWSLQDASANIGMLNKTIYKNGVLIPGSEIHENEAPGWFEIRGTIPAGRTAGWDLGIKEVSGLGADKSITVTAVVVIIGGEADAGYFDGSTPAAGDFTYVWSGAANASTSKQLAPLPWNWARGTDCVAYYSTTKDMIAVMAQKSGVFLYLSTTVTELDNGQEEYTILTQYEIPRAGSIRGYLLDSAAYRPSYVEAGTSGVYRNKQMLSPGGSWLGGEVPLLVSPEDVQAGDTIYLRAAVIPGDYDGPYFDGSSGPGFTWDGEPDASTSTAHADVRQADCECLTAINFATSGVNPLGKFTVELQNINAYWADVFYTTQDVLPDFSDALASFGGVTAPLDDGVYTITGPATNPRITDTVKNAYIQFNGVIGAGQTLTFDAGTWEITTTGGLVATLSSMLIVGMTGRLVRLVPSDTDRQYFVEFTATDTTAATKLTITGRRKYLVG